MPTPVLVLCDDRWHPARTPRAGLAPLDGGDFVFDWIEHASEWSAERMATYPLVVLTKSNHISAAEHDPWMTGEVEAAFLDYVRRGNGLLAIHSGTAGYKETPVLRALLGGVFAHHPAQCPVMVEPLQGHALTTGAAPFTLVDEHYMMDMGEGHVDVFLMAHSEHGAQPAGWTRVEGSGRVAVLTPGHNLEVWLAPSYQTLIHHALRWCAGNQS